MKFIYYKSRQISGDFKMFLNLFGPYKLPEWYSKQTTVLTFPVRTLFFLLTKKKQLQCRQVHTGELSCSEKTEKELFFETTKANGLCWWPAASTTSTALNEVSMHHWSFAETTSLSLKKPSWASEQTHSEKCPGCFSLWRSHSGHFSLQRTLQEGPWEQCQCRS